MKKIFTFFIASCILMLSSVSVNANKVTQSIIYKDGATVTADENSPTGYTVTFVYRSSDPGIEKVAIYSDTFMLWDEIAPQYISGSNGMNLNNVTSAHKEEYGHHPEEYKDTYWSGGGSGSSKLTLELIKVPDEDVWYTQVPLMSGAFLYNYEITKNGVTTARLDDPANPAMVNTATGVRSLSSVVYVPYNAEKQGTGKYRDRSIELPRTDGQTGIVQTITYPASDETDRGMTVYLPYGYDENRSEPYNVLYINMGNSGDQFGNEMRWMHEGALPNIVDNLVTQGKEPFVAVSMNYQDWEHNWAKIEPDVLDYVLPFVESNYNVSTDRLGRGYAGLSMGAATTSQFYLNHPDKFSQIGIWSNGVTPTAQQLENIKKYNDSTTVHIALGKWDFVTASRSMSDILTNNGIKHVFNEIPGGHDWELWQLLFAEFAENYLWEDAAVSFKDVPSGYWAKSDIDRAAALGLVTGYVDGTFKPLKSVTRAEYVAMLARGLKSDIVDVNAVLPFKDANKIEGWAEAYIAKATEQGWITGFADNTFRPNQAITRAEMVEIAGRAMKLNKTSSNSLTFKDAGIIPEWAKASVGAALEVGIIQGRDNNQFDPFASTSRAEAVTVLLGVIEYLNP